MTPTFAEERASPQPVCGVDEAGRGPLAGPVVAAAVILDPDAIPDGLSDSKMLSASRRDILFGKIEASAEVGVGVVGVAHIERLNILWATMLAMERAVDALAIHPAMTLIDGNRAPRWKRPCRTIVKGDAKCHSIAAASIVAKVTRDRMMAELDARHPGYGWSRNQGYGTAEHLAALVKLGPTAHHRAGFAPVRAALAKSAR
ncbi:MAG: ribonuclease HII [Pacificimonas sp.]